MHCRQRSNLVTLGLEFKVEYAGKRKDEPKHRFTSHPFQCVTLVTTHVLGKLSQRRGNLNLHLHNASGEPTATESQAKWMMTLPPNQRPMTNTVGKYPSSNKN